MEPGDGAKSRNDDRAGNPEGDERIDQWIPRGERQGARHHRGERDERVPEVVNVGEADGRILALGRELVKKKPGDV